MDNVEMAIQKVCASKVYTSAEFKREKDNFQSLCKNLERAETKKWLNETLETLMKVMKACMENLSLLANNIQGESVLNVKVVWFLSKKRGFVCQGLASQWAKLNRLIST